VVFKGKYSGFRAKFIFSFLVEAVLMLLCSFALIFYSATAFLSEQLYGQLKVISSSQKIETLWQKGNLSQEEMEKIKWVQSVLDFAQHDLGFSTKGSYSNIVKPERWPMIMMVNCCEPFSMKAHAYHFRPFFSFPYLGFFNFRRAAKEMDEKKLLGFDVGYGYASGWSMLGLLPDPIFRPWLQKSKSALAELIFHELTHSNIFFNDSSAFNENIASFIGRKATLRFLSLQPDAPHLLLEYKRELLYEDSLQEFVFNTMKELSLFYAGIEKLEHQRKLKLKEEKFETIVSRLYRSSWAGKAQKNKLAAKIILQKNAFFSSFSSYNTRNSELNEIYDHRFKQNLSEFIQYFLSL
jgi:predicted aminopeptidase